MRISDWSSDVCSSDLLPEQFRRNMPRRLIPLALACALIAGCTTPESRLDLDSTDTGTEFLYVAEDYDLYPVRRPEGEAWRAQELRARDRKSTRLNSSH